MPKRKGIKIEMTRETRGRRIYVRLLLLLVTIALLPSRAPVICRPCVSTIMEPTPVLIREGYAVHSVHIMLLPLLSE
jgi:hypothetical protein